MKYIYKYGHAKINLALDITGKLDNGYHAISTVMQSLALFDTLYIKKVYKPDYLKLVSNLHWLPNDERNLVWQAASYLIKRFAIKEGVFISIEKNIPASAGLAGGSADCAATLLGMRTLFKLPLSDDELSRISVRFGADVPFCVKRGCVHAGGIGEVLTPLAKLPPMYILVARPLVSASTATIFANYDDSKVTHRPDIARMLRGIENENLTDIVGAMGNVLESVTIARHPIINDFKEFMLEHGALGAMMTGSGPAVFGIFETEQAAIDAYDALITAYPDTKEIFVTTTYYPEGKNIRLELFSAD